MKSIYERLIKILLDNDEWMTANSLAAKLDVSKRSVKTYIAQIKSKKNGLIASSRKGYLIDTNKGEELFAESEKKVPQIAKERINYIITKILTNDDCGDARTDLYQLAEEIFVSIETIRKDMVKVKRKMREFDLFIVSIDYYVKIEGKELDKRKILANILYEEFNKNIMSFEILQKVFLGYDLNILKTIIIEQCNQYHYFINEYALLNLILDIVIGIDRIKKERTFSQARTEKNKIGIREQELARAIALKIEESFHVHYSSFEQEELTIILLSHLMKIDLVALNNENIRRIVGNDCLRIVDEVKILLKNSYFINVDNPDFIVKFTLHIKNLLVRLKNGYITQNPLVEHIKRTCPLIFESALEVANKIREITNFNIKEGEIAYIALHIGANLENQKLQRKNVSCIILFPQYYDFSNIIMKKMNERFGERLDIKTVITSLDREQGNVDLLISTIPINATKISEWVLITPFVNDKDFANIEEKIRKICLRKKKMKLKEQLMQISNPKFFYKNIDLNNKREVIKFMTNKMVQEGYVKPSFYDEIFYRENQASTAFGHIAVPHSMKMNAKKTGMFVLLNVKKPISWNNQLVNIVLMFAINKNEKVVFHEVYDNLIVLLLERDNVMQLIKCNDYNEFIERVIECYC